MKTYNNAISRATRVIIIIIIILCITHISIPYTLYLYRSYIYRDNKTGNFKLLYFLFFLFFCVLFSFRLRSIHAYKRHNRGIISYNVQYDCIVYPVVRIFYIIISSRPVVVSHYNIPTRVIFI